MNSQSFELTNSDKSSCLCVELLIKIIKQFVHEALCNRQRISFSNNEDISLIKIIDINGLMTKMLEIIEFCVNKELEMTSVIESALDLMVPLILQNTELLSELYTRNSFHCLINYLLDSHKTSVRQAIKLTISSIVEAIPSAPNGLEDPIDFFKKLMLKKLPNGHLENCDEYFELLVRLFRYNDGDNEEILNYCIDIIQKTNAIEDKRLGNQDKVLTGYMNLASVLIKSENNQFLQLVNYLCNALFEIPANSLVSPPKFKHEKTRKASFGLLISIARYHEPSKEQLLILLNKNHHSPKLLGHFDSEILERSNIGLVGLRNFGATCYMNSLIQQFFMIKPFREGIQRAYLCVEDPDECLDDNLLYQLQDLFWNLEESDKKYFEPQGFCKAFKDYDGQSMNVSQQQDVDEFFNILCDKIEELLKHTPSSKLLRDCFGGILVHEIESCEPNYPYKGAREEQFYRISLDIKNKMTLSEALDLYVKEDLLDGDNKYLCEEYNCKVAAKKRCLISNLSNTVIIHLKRFEFNYSTMQRTKMNEYCEFPIKLNLKPWSKDTEKAEEYYLYDLVGVLVHSGYADAGHYYSIIKDRETQTWLKFDDKHIEVFDISNLKEECFGGDSGQNWACDMISFAKTRNAYMLVYERTSFLENKTEIINEVNESSLINVSDSIKSKIKKENHEFLRDKLLFDKAYSEFLKEFFEIVQVHEVHSLDKMFSFTQKLAERMALYSLFMSNNKFEKCTSTELYSCPEVLDLHLQYKKNIELCQQSFDQDLKLIEIGTLFAFEMLIRGKQTETFINWTRSLIPIYKVFAPSCL